jgi:hypothetical protein
MIRAMKTKAAGETCKLHVESIWYSPHLQSFEYVRGKGWRTHVEKFPMYNVPYEI